MYLKITILAMQHLFATYGKALKNKHYCLKQIVLWNCYVDSKFCFYVSQVHPENPEWTCYEQSALLDIKYFLGFESTMEKLGMKQYIQNISKGKEIIEFYIEELKKEGITNIPRWIPSGGDQSRFDNFNKYLLI